MQNKPTVDKYYPDIDVTTYKDIPSWYKYVPILNTMFYQGILDKNSIFKRSIKDSMSVWRRHLWNETIMQYRWNYGHEDKKTNRFQRFFYAK